MSEQRSKLGSGQPNEEPEPSGSWSGNGSHHEGALGVLTDDAPTAQASTAAEPTDETSQTTAPDDGSAFVAELVRAMQTIVDLERVRIAENTERRRQSHLDLIHTRDAAEVERLRQVAADDTKAIKTWVDVETKRIQREGERRQKEVREDLDTNLAAHRSKFDSAMEGVESAIASYRAEVAAFFASLDRESDLIELAQQAARHPVFPELEPVPETIAAAEADQARPASARTPVAAADTGTTDQETPDSTQQQPPVVGVMDLQAAAEGIQSMSPQSDTSQQPVSAEASDQVDEDEEAHDPAEPVAVGSATGQGNPSSLFKTVPALRPMSSWLRRENEDPAGGQSGEPR